MSCTARTASKDFVNPHVTMVSTGDAPCEGSVTEVSGIERRYTAKVLDSRVGDQWSAIDDRATLRESNHVSGYVGSMLKRFFELIGLATMGVGVYFVAFEHSRDNACNASEGKLIGLGMSAQCQHVVYAYFGGFVLLAAGVLIVVFGLLATRKAAKRRLTPSKSSLASQYQWVDPKSGRSPNS